MKRRSLAALLIAPSLPAALRAAPADAFPAKAFRLVVSTAPGGGSDIIGRLVGQKLAESSGQPVVVDNKAGAGGVIASKDIVHSPADGYTLLLATSSTHGINPWYYPDIGYDALKDFAPVSVVATTDYALAVPADSPYRTVAELVQDAKTRQVTYGSSGNGTTTHLAAALFGVETPGTKFLHVPYKAAMNSLNALLAREVGFMFENTSLFRPFIASGKLRLLATTGAKRSPVAPDVPTMKEAGVPNFEVIGWFALVENANVPAARLDYLNQQVQKALKAPEVQQRLRELGYEPAPMSLADSRAFMTSQLDRFGAVVKRAGIKAE